MIDASNVSNLLSTDEENEVKMLPLNEYLLSYEDVSCEEPLIRPDGSGWTLPLKVYLVSNELVNCDEPLIVPEGVETILLILLFTEELNATTSPIPKTEPDNEPVIEPDEST